jgi:hypothetical protein
MSTVSPPAERWLRVGLQDPPTDRTPVIAHAYNPVLGRTLCGHDIAQITETRWPATAEAWQQHPLLQQWTRCDLCEADIDRQLHNLPH